MTPKRQWISLTVFTSCSCCSNGLSISIPDNYLKGSDEREARQKWELTLKWRHEERVDSILSEPPKFFELINSMMPTGLIPGKDRNGHLLIIDRWGEVRIQELHRAGVELHDLIRHYTWQLEWLFTVAVPDPNDQVTYVMDMANLSVHHLTPFNINLIKERVRLGCEHYPNRGASLLVVNAPAWASIGYEIVKPLVSAATLAKLKLVPTEEVKRGALLDLIGAEELPTEYGGLSKIKLGQSKWDKLQLEFVSLIRQTEERLQSKNIVPWSKFSGGKIFESKEISKEIRNENRDESDWYWEE